jgi:hypothetical protein
MKLRNFIKKTAPVWAREFYRIVTEFQRDIEGISIRKKIITYLQTLKNDKGLNIDQQNTLDYLLVNKLSVFPNYISKNYRKEDVEVVYDESKGLNYALLSENKRLYFKKIWSKSRIAEYINALKIEQDKDSPHCYLSDSFILKEGSILADIGAAEGFFALSHIDATKKIYLFEPDFEWIKPLQATFEPWKEKVEIIPKYISDASENDRITLDDFFNDKEKPTFVKADVEGFEMRLLSGATQLIANSSELDIVLCTYHKQDDYEILSKLLSERHFHISHSDGYMLFYLDKNFASPYLRRGVIRARKKQNKFIKI